MIFDRAGTIYCLQLPLPQQLSPTWAQTDKQIFLHPRGHHNIFSEALEELCAFSFTWDKIAKILGVSRWTVLRREEKFGLQEMREFSNTTDQELDELARNHISNHGTT